MTKALTVSTTYTSIASVQTILLLFTPFATHIQNMDVCFLSLRLLDCAKSGYSINNHGIGQDYCIIHGGLFLPSLTNNLIQISFKLKVEIIFWKEHHVLYLSLTITSGVVLVAKTCTTENRAKSYGLAQMLGGTGRFIVCLREECE